MMEVTLANGAKISCEEAPIGGGLEGSVYRTLDGQHAIKLYSRWEPEQKAALESIINEFNPVRNDSFWSQFFCWPEQIVVAPQLGVKMPLAKGLRRLDEFLLSKFRNLALTPAERGDYAGYLSITINMARIMSRLHLSGLCYSDPSWKNFLVDPRSGRTVAIDLDGLVVPNFLAARVDGTPYFQAPELVMKTASPSVQTDLHALAVLIYRTLIFHPTRYGLGSVHPLGAGPSALQGAKIYPGSHAEEQDLHAFGDMALFIEHPTDTSNYPGVPFLGSAALGTDVRKLIFRAFVDGLHNPEGRPHAAEWEQALVRLHDRLIPCPNRACEMRHFLLPESSDIRCSFCQTPLRKPATLPVLRLFRPVIGQQAGRFHPDHNYLIVGWPKRTIHHWHVDPTKMPRPSVAAQAVAHFEYDESGGQWYLINDGLEAMLVDHAGQRQFLRPGNRVELIKGLHIVLGDPRHSRLAYVQMIELD